MDSRELVLPDSVCRPNARPSETQPCDNVSVCRGKYESKKDQQVGDPSDKRVLDDEVPDVVIHDEPISDESSQENHI